jgi:hypothetical protein
MSKYFTVEVKPTVTASKQHAAAFGNGELLFDWTEFEIPKGSARLVGASIIARPKGDSAPTANDNALSLVLSKSSTQTLGNINSAPTNRPTNDLLGVVEFAATDYSAAGMASSVVASSPSTIKAPIVITANQNLASTEGYDKYYIGGVSADTGTDFRTIIRINDADIDSASPGTALVVDGLSMTALEHFLPGDILHAHDDAVIGTVASVNSSTSITLTETIATSVLEDDDYVYNIHPYRIILQFEQ